MNGGLAKPALENTHTDVKREILCDHQLDLEHASVLRQPSSCSKSSTSKMHMKFTINLAFGKCSRKEALIVLPIYSPNILKRYRHFQ